MTSHAAVRGYLLLLLLGCLDLGYFDHIHTARFVYEDASWLGSGPTLTLTRSLTRLVWDWFHTPPRAHAFSLAVHILNAVLLGALVYRLGLSELGAWIVAGILLLHPLNTEAVAYAAQHGELIAATGVLMACLFTTGDDLEHGWTWIAIGFSIALGLSGKESAVVGFLLVPLVAWYRTGRLTVALGSLLLLSAVVVSKGPLAILHSGWEGHVQTTWHAWLTVQSAASLRLVLLAFGLGTSSPDFDYHEASAWAICLFPVLLAAAVTALRWRPLSGFGLLWTVLALLPRLLVQIPKSPLAEHQFYVPCMGLILAVVALTERAPRLLPHERLTADEAILRLRRAVLADGLAG